MKVLLDVSAFQSVAQLDQLLGPSGPNEIVGAYIKATQGLVYTDSLAAAFASVCKSHNTPFGYYDFMTNDGAAQQAQDFAAFVKTLPVPSLKPMLDCEGAYQLYALGVEHWETAFGSGAVLYASLAMMPKYVGLPGPKWVAQYDRNTPYVPQASEIAAYASQGYTAWQYEDCYEGMNQDASVLVGNFDDLRLA